MTTCLRMTDLLANPMRVDRALQEGEEFLISIAEALAMRERLRGAIWNPDTIRLTTDVARLIYQGGALTTPTASLRSFARSLVLDHADPLASNAMVTATVVALVIAAAAVIGFAIGHLDAVPQPDLVLRVKQANGLITIAVA